MENELDDIDYFLNDIDYFCLNTNAEEIFRKGERAFVGISPFNGYFNSSTIFLIAKFCKKHFKKFTFFYVGDLAKYTLKIIKPHYDEKKVKEELKHQKRIIKNRVFDSLKKIGFDENQINETYKEFADFEKNPIFIENFNKVIEQYNCRGDLFDFCNKLVNKIIENNNIDKNSICEENIISSHNYFLNEIAIIQSLNKIYNNEEGIILPYHNKDIIEIIDFIKTINHVCYLKFKPKTHFSNIEDRLNIFVLDKNMKYRYLSKNMLDTINLINNTSLTIDQILYKNYFEIFAKYDEKILNIDKSIIEENLIFENEEIVNINNQIKYFKVVKKPLKNQNNKTIGLIGFSTDITEIKKAQIKAEKDKEEELLFRENYLHELNNVEHKKEQIKIMLREFELDEEQKQIMVEILKFEEEKTSCLIKNFALHNSICEGKEIEILKKSTNIINLINREIEYYDLYYKYLNLDKIIIFENDFNNLELLIDEIKISQVIHNLVKNADKHSDAKKIIIKLSVLNNNVLILIKDDGVGINKEINKETLFIHDKNKKIIKSGNGLGLPICKSIIERHDGDIYFKDIEVGTAIEFFLPFNLN